MSWLRVSLARPYPPPESDSESMTHAGSGLPSSECFAWYDRDSSCLRMFQGCLPIAGLSDQYSARWPNSASMRNGMCSQRPESERLTYDAGSTFSRGEYPTPASTPYGSSQNEGQVPHDRPTRGTPSLG